MRASRLVPHALSSLWRRPRCARAGQATCPSPSSRPRLHHHGGAGAAGRFRHSERQRRHHQREVRQILRQPRPARSATRRTRRAMGSSAGARLLARPAGLSRSEKYLRRTTSKPRLPAASPGRASRKSNRWRGTSTPFQRRPSRRDCQDAALGTCTTSRPSGASRCARRRRYARGSVEVLQHVEHGDAGEAARRASGACSRSAGQRGHLLPPPCDGRRLAREIEAHHAEAALAHHAQEQSAAAAHVEQRAARRGTRPAPAPRTARDRAAPARR